MLCSQDLAAAIFWGGHASFAHGQGIFAKRHMPRYCPAGVSSPQPTPPGHYVGKSGSHLAAVCLVEVLSFTWESCIGSACPQTLLLHREAGQRSLTTTVSCKFETKHARKAQLFDGACDRLCSIGRLRGQDVESRTVPPVPGTSRDPL